MLLLLPLEHNKLQVSWRGPFVVTEKKGGQNYRIRVGDKEKLYHVNLLKRYRERESPTEFVVATVVTEELDDNGGVAEVLPSCPLTGKETYVDVVHDVMLTSNQRGEVEEILHDYEGILPEKPGVKDLEEFSMKLLEEKMKDRLTSDAIVKLPDVTKDFVLRTDASDRGLSAVLLQEHDGDLFPVAYASRKLNTAERNYSVTEKECLAIVFGIHKFQRYLYGRKFILETDHQPLAYLAQAKLTNGRLMRWSLFLQQYQVQLRYIRGNSNVGADCMSRLLESEVKGSLQDM